MALTIAITDNCTRRQCYVASFFMIGFQRAFLTMYRTASRGPSRSPDRARFDEPALEFGIMHDVLGCAVDLHLYVVRRSSRSERGVEGLGDHAGQTGFRGGRDIRRRSNSRSRIHCQQPYLARRVKIGDLVCHVDDDHLDLTAEEISKRRPCSLVRNADDIQAARQQLEHLARKKGVRPRTTVAKRDLAGICSRIGDELLERVHRQAGSDRNRRRGRTKDGNWRKIGERIVASRAGRERLQDMRVRAAKQEKIAIRRSARDLNGSNNSTGTAAIFDDERSELTHSPVQSRAMMSCAPPGDDGTISRFGRDG